MTTTAPTGPEPEVLEWKPRGHPVRVALAIVAVIVVVSWVLMWFGAGQPRVEVVVHATDRPASSDEFAVTVEITNRAQGDVTVLGVGESVDGLELLSADMSRERDGSATESVELGGGDRMWVELRYRASDCDVVWDATQDLPVRTRTLLGLRRTVTTQLTYPSELVVDGTFDDSPFGNNPCEG